MLEDALLALFAQALRCGSNNAIEGGLGRPSAQLALVVTLSDRHTSRTQDVVGGGGVEMEVG